MLFSFHNRAQLVALCFNDGQSLVCPPSKPRRCALRWAHRTYWFGLPATEPRVASARAAAREPGLRCPATSNLTRREFLEQDRNGHRIEGGSSRRCPWDCPEDRPGAPVNRVWRGGCGTTLSLYRSGLLPGP